MLWRDKGGGVREEIEIGSKKKKTALGAYSSDSGSVLAFFFLVEAV